MTKNVTINIDDTDQIIQQKQKTKNNYNPHDKMQIAHTYTDVQKSYDVICNKLTCNT